MSGQIDLLELLGDAWPAVLQHLEDGVLVLDSQRTLRFVNQRARGLLGYGEQDQIGGRCRLTTQGLDCENACPLTFAIESDIKQVENFSTVYHTDDGTPVPLSVTVIPLLDADGEFRGAVEILRPTEPDPGFVLAGQSAMSIGLRRHIDRIARNTSHVVLVGDGPACTDVARAIHRFSGVADALFHSWVGSWESLPVWPPGTVFAFGDAADSVMKVEPPDGWRVVAGFASKQDVPAALAVSFELVELPSAADLGDDLSLVVAAWIDDLAPGLEVSSSALVGLTRIAKELGFEKFQGVVIAAVASAGNSLEEEHVPLDGYGTELVDELLQEPNPLAALEKRLLNEVLHRSGWKMQDAADRLGISRVTLWRKIKDHGIERPENEEGSKQ